MSRRHRFAFTGILRDDGTWEIEPRLAHRAWPEAVHFVLCWLAGLPHLVTVDPECGVWFRRWWLVRLSFFGLRLQLNLHSYPNEAPYGESFGAHCHPLHTATLLLRGCYHHLRIPNMRVDGNSTSWVQSVQAGRGWLMNADDGHRITRMRGGTWSLFAMWGRPKDWWFLPGETMGSSRVLRYTRGT